jgi:hypothetical protein
MHPQQTDVMNRMGAAGGASATASRTGGHVSTLTGLGADEGAALEMIATSPEGFGVLIFAGAPIDEPMSWRGPIVMSTTKELDTAWRELQRGAFYKKSAEGDWRALAESSDVPYTTPKVVKTPALPQ